MKNFCQAITRRKKLEQGDVRTELNRCLNVLDLTLIGIGNMVGPGIYVLTGTVIRHKSGPSIMLSFFIAGVTAFLNALCYGELASRFPKAGSAYTYTYIVGGELLAFVIGWSVILEYMLSVSSAARGFSATVKSLVSSTGLINITQDNPVDINDFKSWFNNPDIIAFFIVVIIGAILPFGAKISSNVNSIITSINLMLLLFITSIMYVNPFQGATQFAPASHGGFMPFQFTGMLGGAATCFFNYIGFDAVSISSEEAIRPKRDLPISTATSVGLVTLVMVLSTSALVIFQPWWLVDESAPYTMAFVQREGFLWAAYIAGIGSILGILANLLTCLYSLPRVAYSMASDGLLPKALSNVDKNGQTPVIALIVFGLLSALLALFLRIEILADFLSIGTLIAYAIVSSCVCILRYRTSNYSMKVSNPSTSFTHDDLNPNESDQISSNGSTNLINNDENNQKRAKKIVGKLKDYFKNIPILRDALPGEVPKFAMILIGVFIVGLGLTLLFGWSNIQQGNWLVILFMVFFILGIMACILTMIMHHQDESSDFFMVPFVPFIPVLAVFLDITLILMLSGLTWLRFFVWTFIGLLIYFFYGIWNSKEKAEFIKNELNSNDSTNYGSNIIEISRMD